MKENNCLPATWEKSNDCILETFAGRPKDCPNNPYKYPNNYRPKICMQCPLNPEIWKISLSSLPEQYILFKQGHSKE